MVQDIYEDKWVHRIGHGKLLSILWLEKHRCMQSMIDLVTLLFVHKYSSWCLQRQDTCRILWASTTKTTMKFFIYG